MPRNTDNHSYSVPVEGDTDYQSMFDSWFDTLDQDIEIRDVESNLNDYQPYDDAKFVASDSGKMFRGDGNSWVLVDRQVDEFTATSVNADELHTTDRDPMVVVKKKDSEIIANGPDGTLAQGTDAHTVVQTALDWVGADSERRRRGQVFVRSGDYSLNDQLHVGHDTGLTTGKGALFINQLSDEYKPCIHFDQRSHSHRIRVNAQGQTGIKIGREGAHSALQLGTVLISEVGGDESADGHQYGARIVGWGLDINRLKVGQANRGIWFDNCAEGFIDQLSAVNCGTGVEIQNSGALKMGFVNIDSNDWVGIRMNGSDNIQLNAIIHGPSVGNAGMEIGDYDTVRGVKARTVHKIHDGTGIKIGDALGTTINSVITNETAETDPPDIQTGLDYIGSGGVREGLKVSATIDDAIPTRIAGSPYGILNGVAYESAGAGNAPSTTWTEHQFVENTDDNTLWWKDSTGTMRQVI